MRRCLDLYVAKTAFFSIGKVQQVGDWTELCGRSHFGECAKVSCCESAGQSSLVKG
jgi:hypothetical protein